MVSSKMNDEKVREAAGGMFSILGLFGEAGGGSWFRFPRWALSSGANPLEWHGYCQPLVRPQQGGDFSLHEDGISCPAAASALAFHPLPERLKSAKGLVEFGIVWDSKLGRRMFDAMGRLPPGQRAATHLFPKMEWKSYPIW